MMDEKTVIEKKSVVTTFETVSVLLLRRKGYREAGSIALPTH